MTDRLPTSVVDNSATEETGSQLVVAPDSAVEKQQHSFLRVAKRDLSEDEVASPAARRFLIADIDRMANEIQELRGFRDRYYQTATELAVEREHGKKSFWTEVLSYVCLSVGAAGLGAAPSYLALSNVGWVFVVLSAVLLIAGIVAKVRQ